MIKSRHLPRKLQTLRPVTAVIPAALVLAFSLVACGPQAGNPVASNGTAVPLTLQQSPAQPYNGEQRQPNLQEGASPNGTPMPRQALPSNNESQSHQPPLREAETRNQPQDEVIAPVPGVGPTSPPVAVASARLGKVLAVEPIRNRPQGNGTGAVIGGVLGAAVGNQFGHGGGRAVTTVLGGVGGAVAGNNVERNHREGIVGYRVSVRLDNGSSRTFQESSPDEFRVGDRVRVDRGRLRPV